jgi:hypothetical protein
MAGFAFYWNSSEIYWPTKRKKRRSFAAPVSFLKERLETRKNIIFRTVGQIIHNIPTCHHRFNSEPVSPV